MGEHIPQLQGKTAIVTGGSRGIGASIVQLLAQHGCHVLSIARDMQYHDSDLATITPHAMDLTQKPDGQTVGDAVMQVAENTFQHADILVNCAGMGLVERAEKSSDEDFEKILALNVAAVQSISSAFVMAAKQNKREAVILNVSSLLAQQNMRGSALYGASKAALEHLTKAHALEWARHKIRVNAIAPGWFDTAMTHDVLGGPVGTLLAQKNPMGRLGIVGHQKPNEQGDLDGAVLFLVSPASAYITGIVLPVDGGQHLTS